MGFSGRSCLGRCSGQRLSTRQLRRLVSGALGIAPRVILVDLLLFTAIGLAADTALKRLATRDPKGHPRKSAVVYGVGPNQLALLRELRLNQLSGFEAFSFLEDDPNLMEAILDGVPVLGTVNTLCFLAELHGVRQVIRVQPELSEEQPSPLFDLAAQGQVAVELLPG